jgi:Rrf2 family protein
MLEIALAGDDAGILQKDIAMNQGISLKYLDHIIIALKVAGLITNTRGKKSGYRLTRDPSQITMYDIHNAFEPGICVINCIDRNIICERENTCAARDFWKGLNDQMVEYFKSVTLKDMVERQLMIYKDYHDQSLDNR